MLESLMMPQLFQFIGPLLLLCCLAACPGAGTGAIGSDVLSDIEGAAEQGAIDEAPVAAGVPGATPERPAGTAFPEPVDMCELVKNPAPGVELTLEQVQQIIEENDCWKLWDLEEVEAVDGAEANEEYRIIGPYQGEDEESAEIEVPEGLADQYPSPSQESLDLFNRR